MTDTIEIKLVYSNVAMSEPCHVCGGSTGKYHVLAEGEVIENGSPETIRVCEECLKAGNIDERLEDHAKELEQEAWELEAEADQLETEAQLALDLIGRLRVPTFEQWKAALDGHERLCTVLHHADYMEFDSKESLIRAFEQSADALELLPLTEEEVNECLDERRKRKAA